MLTYRNHLEWMHALGLIHERGRSYSKVGRLAKEIELDLDPESAISEEELQVAFGVMKQAGYVLMKVIHCIILARRWPDEQLLERYGAGAPLTPVRLIRPLLEAASTPTDELTLASDAS